MFISYRVDQEIKLTYPLELNAQELASIVAGSNEDLNEWVAWASLGFGYNEALSYIRFLNKKFTDNEKFWVFIKYHEKIVGGIGLNRWDLENQSTEIGYWLAKEARGNGIVTRAGTEMIRYAFEEFGYNRIELKTHPDNAPSVAVANRLGFKKEGVLRDAEFINDEFRDLEIYSLIKKEWDPAD